MTKKSLIRYFKSLCSAKLKIAFRYPGTLIMPILSEFIVISLGIAIWTSMMPGRENYDRLAQFILYTIIAGFLRGVLQGDIAASLGAKIRTGQVAIDSVRPQGLLGQLILEDLSTKATGLLIRSFPIIIIFGLIYRPNFSFSLLPAGLLALLASILTLALVKIIVGALAFWVIEIRPINRIVGFVMNILAGAFIPISIYPSWLGKAAVFFPFQYIYYTPAGVLSGQLSLTADYFIKMGAWLVILLLSAGFIWSKGRKRMVVQGG